MEDHFTAICGTPIWNTKIIYSSYPDFTFCFQYTILKWIPCFMLWLSAPFWTYMLTKSVENNLKYSILSLLKMVTNLMLIGLEAYYLFDAYKQSKFLVYYMTPLVLIVTYVLVLFFNHYERVSGLRSSSLLFVFWTCLTLCSTITFRSKLLYHIYYTNANKDVLIDVNLFDVYMFYAFFTLVLVNLFLSVFSEKYCESYENDINGTRKSMENSTPLLSKLSFLWIDPLIHKGFKRDLTRADIWEIDYAETSECVTNRLEREWNRKVADFKRRKMQRESTKNDSPARNVATAMYKTNLKNNENELILTKGNSETNVKTIRDQCEVKEPSIMLCLWTVFGGKFIAGTFLKLVQDLLGFSGPVLLDLIIKFIEDKQQKMLVGVFLIGLLFLSTFVQSIIMQHYQYRMYLVGARIRTSLVSMIYKKSLRLSTTSRKESTVGEMTNLVAVNAQLFLTLISFLNMIWSSPVQIIICIYMLWRYLGIAAFAGLAVTVIIAPITWIASDWNKKLCVKKLKNQDLRIKVISEILAGIKVIKFYGWELSFQKIVDKIRNNEMKFFSRNALVGIIQSFTWASAPFIVSAVSYATFVMIDEKNNLDPSTAFVSFTLFYLIRFPLALLPQTVQLCVQGLVSLTRIQNFLLLEEVNEGDIQHENTADIAIQAKKVNLGWNKHEYFLYNLNFEIAKGKLVAVVGKVGSGKSSFLGGLLGEMHKLNDGTINVNGSTAYVSQQAWIQNATIKDNILFGKELNDAMYDAIVKACSLVPDFNIMPEGDATQIGEKGINLSGGQKQRISLARALYSNADIYMLDDPLSAVDAHVGKNIFDKVVGPKGMLKNKTRLFVTNSLSFLPQCDQVIMIDNGRVMETGTYAQMLENKSSPFNDFIKLFLEDQETNKENIKEQAKQDLLLKEAAKNYTRARNPSTSRASIPEYAVNGSPVHSRAVNHQNPSLVKQDSISSQSYFDSSFQMSTMKTNDTARDPDGDNNIIDKEVIESGSIKFSVLLDYIKKCGYLNSTLFLLFFLLSNAFLAASSLWLSAWSNEATSDQPLKAKYFRLTIYILLGLAHCILLNISNVLLVLMYIRAARLFHKKLLSSILRSTLHFFESTPSGRIINRFSRDIESIETAVPDSFKIVMFCFMNIIHTFIILSYSTPFSLLLIVPILIVYIFIQRYYVSSSRQLARLDSATKSPIFSYFSETLQGVSSIKAYKCQHFFIKRMQNHIDENTVYIYTANCAERWLVLRLDLIANVITTLAALFAVFSRDSLSPGLVGLSISLSITVSQALNYFVKMGAEFEANITGVERIREYFQIPHEAEWVKEDSESRVAKSWPSQGKIIISKYACKYRKDLDPVLNEINAEIMPGEKIGIVGRTGAGKSSMALGLFRLIEHSTGDILIDDVNISKIGLHNLRHKLTIIPQDPVIFSGTLKMNLDPFTIHSNDELWEALELAHLKKFVEDEPDNLDFKCTEGGENLSVGQRQLICLARALLRKTKILILDEATASIDHNTDELIQNTIRTQFSDCTVLTIAHRLNTIMDSSRIMVLDKGNIVEFDTPKVLLQKKTGHFYSMAKDAGLVG